MLGLYVVFLGAVFSGIWLVLMGWFVIASATAESGQATLQVLLWGVPVREAMIASPLVAAADTTVAGFLAAPFPLPSLGLPRHRQNAVGRRPYLGCLPSGADRTSPIMARGEAGGSMEERE